MTNARIRFATDILRRLGEELNPSLDQGVVELVKNAYDADAQTCNVELISTERSGGTLRVRDDGRGMTAGEIQDGFLVLGRSTKSINQRTPRGRLPAGSKGLGRLAALRLGRYVHLVSRPLSQPQRELHLEIDWKDFEDAALVDDVLLDIQARKRRSGTISGTHVEVRGLRSPVRRMEVKRLARALVLLADPFGDDPSGFSPTLHAAEFADLERLVRSRYFDDAEFHLRAGVNSDGFATAKVVDWRGGVLFEADHAAIAISREGAPYRCPPATFDLWAFLLTRGAFQTRTVTVQAVREWLEHFGGVHLYVNGLRVAPYGNPGDDWLELNLRRVQSPEERPSTNTSIGRVAVVDTNDELLQKTDRSGLVEQEAFLELRQFAQDAAEWMARERLRAAERRRKSERTQRRRGSQQARDRVEEAINRAADDQKPELLTAFRRYERAREKEAETLRREVQLYRTLSTAGITAATFAHEAAGSPVKIIGQAVKAIDRRGRKALGEEFPSVLGAPVDNIKRSLRSLAVLSTATLRLVDHEKRRVGRIDVHDLLESVLETFGPFLDGRDVKVRTEFFDGSPYLRGTPAALESIVTNLLNNSIAAFERSGTGMREVVFRTELLGQTLVLTALDTGPGIDGVDIRDIWSPGITSQPNGTGLGLTIVRDTVADLDGSVTVSSPGDLGGATFRIEIPVLGW